MPNAFTEIGWKLGLQIGFWFAVALIALAILLLIIHIIARRLDDWSVGWGIASATTFVMALLPVGATIAEAVPFEDKYHHVYSITGTVTSVSNTLDNGSGELTYRPVAELAEHDFPLVVNSSRAASLVDKRVTFTCHVRWVHLSGDWYDCQITEVSQ